MLKLGEMLFGSDNLLKWYQDPDPQVFTSALQNAIDICFDADSGAETFHKRLAELLQNGENFLKDAELMEDVYKNISSVMGVSALVVYRCLALPPESDDIEIPEWRKELHDYFYMLLENDTKEES